MVILPNSLDKLKTRELLFRRESLQAVFLQSDFYVWKQRSRFAKCQLFRCSAACVLSDHVCPVISHLCKTDKIVTAQVRGVRYHAFAVMIHDYHCTDNRACWEWAVLNHRPIVNIINIIALMDISLVLVKNNVITDYHWAPVLGLTHYKQCKLQYVIGLLFSTSKVMH